MEQLYDERRALEVPQTWKREDGDEKGVDMFYLRVRLFKSEVVVRRDIMGVDRVPIYFLLEEDESFEGDPQDDRQPRTHSNRRTYTTGPDSKRIRQAVEIASAFGGMRAYNSK